MKFSREFYFRTFYFRAPPFFSFSRSGKKVWFCQTKTSRMLVFCWCLVRGKYLKAVKVGFVVCKGVFVAYIFYCTNQCSFIWHIWHDPYFCSKWNHSTVNWRQTLTDGGSVWSIYVLYNYLWLRKTFFCDCSCYRFFCKNFAAISIKIARRYKYL